MIRKSMPWLIQAYSIPTDATTLLEHAEHAVSTPGVFMEIEFYGFDGSNVK